MPITSSAKKALRVSKKKRIFNVRKENAIDNSKKAIKKLMKEGKTLEAEKLLPKYQKALDKAVKTKLLKKNTASRLKSRLAKSINKLKK